MKNKKGKKFHKKLCWLSTVYHSGFIASATAFIVLLLFSVGGIVDACSIDKDKHILLIIFSIAAPCVSLVVSLIGTIKSIIALKHNCFHRKFLEEENYKQEVIKSVGGKISPEHAANGYKWDIYGEERFLCSDDVDKALSERAEKLFLKVSPKKKPFSNDQREALFQKASQKVAAGTILFNGKMVSLCTDMFVDTVLSAKNNITETALQDLKLVEVKKTDYFSNLTTNDLIYSRLLKYDNSAIFYGRNMTVDCFDTLYNLSESLAANIIGVSTLAITKDGYIVINKQDNHNDGYNHHFVPSGSGSSDFDDLINCLEKEEKNEDIKKSLKLKKKYTCSFKNFITYGMARELVEESHLCKEDEDPKAVKDAIKKYAAATCVCGYIRLLNRGGKPDFFGFTLLDLEKKDIVKLFEDGKKKYEDKNVTDFNEACEQRYVDIKGFIKCKNEDFESLLKTEKDGNIKISVQLYYLLKLLQGNEKILEKFKK